MNAHSAVDIEEIVLGAMLLEKGAYLTAFEIIKSKDVFFDKRHQLIFRAIQALYKTGEPIDVLTVTVKLRKAKALVQAGDSVYIAELTQRVSSGANIEYHARIILEKYIVRQTQSIAANVLEKTKDPEVDGLELLTEAQKQFQSIGEFAVSREANNQKVLKEMLIEMEGAANNKSPNKIDSGFRDIPAWEEGELIILGADTGMGKSALLLCWLLHIAVDLKLPAVYFNFEMTHKQLFYRALSILSGIPLTLIKTGKAIADNRLHKAIKQLEEAEFIINSDKSMDIYQVRASMFYYNHKYGAKAFGIDYIQRIKGSYRGQRTTDRISEITRIAKVATLELNCFVIALSSLSRDLKNSEGNKPKMYHLKESGDIEFDADRIYLLYRAYKYDIPDADKNHAILFNEKFRQDEQVDIPLHWSGETQTYKDWGYYEGLKPINPTEPRETPNWGFTDH